MLELKFGTLSRQVQRQLERLVAEQSEALCAALVLLQIQSKDDLNRWLKQHASAR